MASFVIESAANWVGKQLLEEGEFLAKVSDKVKGLQRELECMKCFLSDADHKQCKSATIRQWISEIRDLAEEAEDVIGLYILNVSHKRERPRGLIPWTDLKWLLCCMKDAGTLHSVGSNIDTLTAKINELTGRLQRYGITISNDERIDPCLVFEKWRTYFHTEDVVIGLDEPVKEVADQLVNGPQKVVVIHGMPGIGKTTLARKVYNDASLKSQFTGFAWAYVSQQLQLGSVCREILQQLIPTNDKEERELVRELQDSLLPPKLYAVLKRTECLVVLDDIWSTEDWNCLTHAFPLNDNSCHSKVLVTTRISQIFSCYPRHVVYRHPAKFLSPNQSWELLEKKAYFNKDNAEPLKVAVGEEMLKHCNGHPLAIVVLGGILATKTTVREWQDVCVDLQSNLQGHVLHSGMYEVLALSYYELSYHLKACFLVLGYFPKGFEIPAERLYHLWIAEGIVSEKQVQEGGKRSLEDIAKVYLNELVHKGIVHVVSRDVMGDIKMCRLHDLMRDSCLQIAKGENFLLTSVCELQQQHPSSCILDDRIRRLAVYVADSVQGLESLPNSTKLPYLRSLVLFPSGKVSYDQSRGDILQSLELLRILDFTGFSSIRLSSSIGTLIYLRYLSLRGTQITELPSEIGNLRSLLILDLRLEGLRLPNVLWKIKSLKQLYLPFSRVWPDELGYMIEGGKALRLDKLSNLEIIEGLDLDTAELKGLQELSTSLSLQRLKAKCSHKKENLDLFLKSSTIKSLSLRMKGSTLHDHPTMLSDCHYLHCLIIGGGDIGDIIAFPQNLMKLQFWRCRLSKETISVLEKLPHLKKLSLVSCDDLSDWDLDISSNGFPELTHFVLKDNNGFIKWTIRTGLPQLTHLVIEENAACMEWTIEGGGLPQLTHLVIEENPGRMEWTIRGGLPQLTYLVIEENPGCMEWTVERGGLPKLIYLAIKENPGRMEWTIETGGLPQLIYLAIKENPGRMQWTIRGGLPRLTCLMIKENTGCMEWTIERGGLPELIHLVIEVNPGRMKWTIREGLLRLTLLRIKENPGCMEWTIERGGLPKLIYLGIKGNPGRMEWTIESGGLPRLIDLLIEENPGCMQWTIRGGLPRLTRLMIEENPGLMEWTIERGGLPQLIYLAIKKNPGRMQWTIRGGLPRLARLMIEENLGRMEWTVRGSLPRLTHLMIEENPGCMEWTIERGGLPELTHLAVKENPGCMQRTVERGGLPELIYVSLTDNPGLVNLTVRGLPMVQVTGIRGGGCVQITTLPDDQEG